MTVSPQAADRSQHNTTHPGRATPAVAALPDMKSGFIQSIHHPVDKIPHYLMKIIRFIQAAICGFFGNALIMVRYFKDHESQYNPGLCMMNGQGNSGRRLMLHP
jgi:hypothetical protein